MSIIHIRDHERLDRDERMILSLLERFGRRVTTSDLVELAYERGVDLTWSQVDMIRKELQEREVQA